MTDTPKNGAKRDAASGLQSRNVVLTEFPWADLEPRDFGDGLLQLLQTALQDGADAGDAFARALEGLEIMGLQGISLAPGVRNEATQLIEQLREAVSAAYKDLNGEWLHWCLEAAALILKRDGLKLRADSEEVLFVRAGRYAFEGFCIGRRIREARIADGKSAVLNPKKLN
ncbi:hypothetical protein [Agrobacterium tumefaciens]|uniref:hypothetical protein n=1 Tax=Agrobacterium tumefaciens TaxID=358 RepID=UPI003BA39E01